MFDHSDLGNDGFVGVKPPVETVSGAELSTFRPFLAVNALEYRADITFDISM